jgi:hypothetical protein
MGGGSPEMPPPDSNQKTFLSALLGVAAAAALGLVIAFAYLIVMKQVQGGPRGMDGLALAASIVIFPVAAGMFTALAWAPLWWWRRTKGRPLGTFVSLILGTALGLVIGFAMAGPGGFRMTGGAPAFNYAFMAPCGGGALVFQMVTGRLLRRG